MPDGERVRCGQQVGCGLKGPGNFSSALFVPYIGRPGLQPVGNARAGMWKMGLRKLGAGCPTGPAMSPRRRVGLGGACTSTYAPDLQHLLPVHGEPNRGRRFVAGRFSAGVQDVAELSFRAWGLWNLGYERDAKPADRSLPENQAGPVDGFAGRQNAGGREQRVGGTQAGPASVAGRVERTSTKGIDAAFAGIARGGDFAGSAAAGIRGDSSGAGSTGRNGQVTNQSRAHRTGAYIAGNGSEAVVKGGRRILVLRICGTGFIPSAGGKP